MSELLQVAAALRRASSTRQESVLATVVRTEGSTYRRIGARLVAFPDGSHVGAVSAGCIEADVLLRAERVRADGQVKLLTYETRSPEDLVWGSGTRLRHGVSRRAEPPPGRSAGVLARRHGRPGNRAGAPFAGEDDAAGGHCPTLSCSPIPTPGMGHCFTTPSPLCGKPRSSWMTSCVRSRRGIGACLKRGRPDFYRTDLREERTCRQQ